MTNLYTSPEADLTTETKTNQVSDPKIFSPSGRIGRIRYLAYNTLGALVFIISIGILSILTVVLADSSYVLMAISIVLLVILSVAYIVISIFWTIKRLHDRNHTGFFWLILLIPFVQFLLYLYLIFAPGEKLTNNYGHPAPANSTGLMVAGLGGILFVPLLGILAAIAIPAYDEYASRVAEAERTAIQQFEDQN